jgi:glycosyltransferase involved in cell wall biosynthesis
MSTSTLLASASARPWPRTDRPLSIAILGWARLAAQGSQGSGYNLSTSELAAGLVMSGHKVSYLASGRRYSFRPGSRVGKRETWRGAECYEVINSPNLSPAVHNFSNMDTEMSYPRDAQLIVRWLDEVGAQIVHIHSIEGYGLDVIAAIRASGRPVVVTPHNYWYVCPQVNLFYQDSTLCTDYDGGRRCESCVPGSEAWKTRLMITFRQSVERVVGRQAVDHLLQATEALVKRTGDLLHGREKNDIPSTGAPDPEVALGFDAGAPEAHDGLVRISLDPLWKDTTRRVGSAHLDENERFLRADHHLKVSNHYGRRRIAGIEALNAASLVIPPSDYVRRVYVTMGLDERKSRVVRLGQPHFDQINRRVRRGPFYNARPWDAATSTRPLRIAYMGTMSPSKGMDVISRAIPLLDKSVRQRCQFLLRVQGGDSPYRHRLAHYPEVSFLGGYDISQLLAAAGEYDVGILPHVWFENSPLVLLEHLHAGKYVICSRLGGPPEWIDPPRNGLLFPGGHPEELAACITRVATGEVPIPSPREIHEATPILQSYPGHVAEVEGIYRELLGSARATPTAAGA